MNKLDFSRFSQLMKIRKIPFKWQRINSVRFNNSKETLKHFMCKSICSYILVSSGHTIFTEKKFRNGAEADIYDATENIVVEFETIKSAEKERIKFMQFKPYTKKVIIINTAEISNDINMAFNQIKKKIL